MPNVLEISETTQKEQYQRPPETVEAMFTESSAPRRLCRGMATVARLLGFTPQAQQRRSMIVDSRYVEMQPIDRLTRDFPFLYIQASCV